MLKILKMVGIGVLALVGAAVYGYFEAWWAAGIVLLAAALAWALFEQK